MDYATASTRLRKMVLFHLIKQLNLDICFRCKLKITDYRDLSLDHIKDWLDEPNGKDLFFDVENIAFSHIKCNISTRRSRVIELTCDGCGITFIKLLRDYKKLHSKGRKKFFCKRTCYNKWHSSGAQGVSDPHGKVVAADKTATER